MCGISGIITSRAEVVTNDHLKQMTEIIAHRGPDDCGYYHENNVYLGHRRLSIIDLSDVGHQPMVYKARYIITFNGEIYNYKEIRTHLKSCGYQFQSETDTEVILAAYDHWGSQCVSHFNGMWAFAIYDRDLQTVFCSRDRFGVKPFYYYQGGGYFIFSSEIKQILTFDIKRKVNIQIVSNFLLSGLLEHSQETFFDGIYKLGSGHNLTYNLRADSYEVSQYYDLEVRSITDDMDESGYIKTYQTKLYDAIKLRLRSDVKVGTCLSGGLDSSSIAAIASSMYQGAHKFNAIHARASEEALDESGYAIAVAERAGLAISIIEPTAEQFYQAIDEVVYTQEEPFGGTSIFMQYFVMQQAKALDCQVMLDGQGADEVLLGYEKYYTASYINALRYQGLLSAIRQVKASKRNNQNVSYKRALLFLASVIGNQFKQRFNMRKFSFIKSHYQLPSPILNELDRSYYSTEQLQKYEITTTSLPGLLRVEDKNAMRHSVEARLPFLDYRAVEAAISLPIGLKIKDGWTKYALRKAAEHFLPPKVLWRKNKLGFCSPENTWQKQYQQDMTKQIKDSYILNELCHKNELFDSYDSLPLKARWRIFNVAAWERIYGVGI